MATISASDGGGLTKQFAAEGDGSAQTPFVPHHYHPQLATLFGAASLLTPEGALKVALQVQAQEAGAAVVAQVYCPALGSAVAAAIKSTPGQLLAIGVTNICAEIRYLQIFDRASAPSAGTAPKRSYLVNSGEFLQITDLFTSGQSPGLGLPLATGIAWGWSKDALIYTAGAAAEVMLEARYI